MKQYWHLARSWFAYVPLGQRTPFGLAAFTGTGQKPLVHGMSN